MSRMVTAPGSAREYETIYILKPDVDAESADKVGQRLQEVVTRENGKLTKVELWGRRRLAYDIAKHKRGVYVYLKYLGDGRVVAEVERNLRLSDGVLKYQTVLVGNDIELGKVEVQTDDVKFERLELPPVEEDREDSRERQLGLIEPEKAPRQEYDAEEGELDAEAAPEEEEG
ncbi:MAG: 30S ribosomal protein S6 [Polyangiaceae bacterium]|nr:30S ribosomal protein S6 [Polyangiaceae bacterium]